MGVISIAPIEFVCKPQVEIPFGSLAFRIFTLITFDGSI